MELIDDGDNVDNNKGEKSSCSERLFAAGVVGQSSGAKDISPPGEDEEGRLSAAEAGAIPSGMEIDRLERFICREVNLVVDVFVVVVVAVVVVVVAVLVAVIIVVNFVVVFVVIVAFADDALFDDIVLADFFAVFFLDTVPSRSFEVGS